MLQTFNPEQELFKIFFTAVATFIAAGGAAMLWQYHQKRRELQFEALKQFYGAYGEFVTTWKLWNYTVYHHSKGEIQDFAKRQTELLEKAARAEAQTEGILLKIATETKLSIESAHMLGCFRQSFKQLRKCIRRGEELPYGTSDDEAYVAFKCLSTSTANLLARPWTWKTPPASTAIDCFMAMTSNDREDEWIKSGVGLCPKSIVFRRARNSKRK